MSFILDALKKSETDRQRQSAPTLFEVKVAPTRRHLPTWAIALAVLLAVNLLGLAWMMLRKPADPSMASAAPPPSAPSNAAAPNNPQGMVTVTMPASSTPTTIAIVPNSSQANSNGASVSDAGVVAPSHSPPLAEEPLLSHSEPAVNPDYDANDYAPAITPAEARAVTARRGGIPSRDEVLANGTALPDLRLDLHVYDADAANRFVFINMRKLREGDSLPEGVRVDAITPSGALLTYRGTRFSIDGN